MHSIFVCTNVQIYLLCMYMYMHVLDYQCIFAVSDPLLNSAIKSLVDVLWIRMRVP